MLRRQEQSGAGENPSRRWLVSLVVTVAALLVLEYLLFKLSA
jgi:hypothetical protein